MNGIEARHHHRKRPFLCLSLVGLLGAFDQAAAQTLDLRRQVDSIDTSAPAERSQVRVIILSGENTERLLVRLTEQVETSMYDYLVDHRRWNFGDFELGEVREFKDRPNEIITAAKAARNAEFDAFMSRHRGAHDGNVDAKHSLGLVARFHVVDLVHTPWPADDMNADLDAKLFLWWTVTDGKLSMGIDDAVKGDVVLSTGHFIAKILNKSRISRPFKVPKRAAAKLEALVQDANNHVRKVVGEGPFEFVDLEVTSEGELQAVISGPPGLPLPAELKLPDDVVKLPPKPPKHLGRTTERCKERKELLIKAANGTWKKIPMKKTVSVNVHLQDGEVKWKCGGSHENTNSPGGTNMIRVRRTGSDRKFYVDWYQRR